MNLPTFTHADVQALKAFASAVHRKTAFGRIPSVLEIGSLAVPTRDVAVISTSCGSPLGAEDLRALYSPCRREIQFWCGGVTIEPGQAAYDHIVRVAGHEALHALQHESFAPEQIVEAANVAKAAPHSDDAYATYITCDVELPAHAVMIALDLRRGAAPNFDAAAKCTPIYVYIEQKLGGSQQKAAALQSLVALAREMHARLSPP